jgi:phenylacetate-coenzyme A ligase PaaK-like adenylate-forming protein
MKVAMKQHEWVGVNSVPLQAVKVQKKVKGNRHRHKPACDSMPFLTSMMMGPRDNFFEISSEREFAVSALETFRYQYMQNAVYREFVDARKVSVGSVSRVEDIPCLPIELFKTRDVVCGAVPPQAIFRSSGTTGMVRSRHLVTDLTVYRRSFVKGFELRYGDPHDVQFLALTPTSEQAPDSSLVYMIQKLMDLSSSPENGFFLASHSGLSARLRQRRAPNRKVILIGLTYALVDFANSYPGDYTPLTVIETGGMKGRRSEITRDELHELLCPAFGVEQIHSEYGMTELLSQAWSQGEGRFATPPWMKVLIRDANDPLSYLGPGETGGINIIDLANIESCSFIATQDLGRMHLDGQFEVLGRFEASDARGCSLLS